MFTTWLKFKLKETFLDHADPVTIPCAELEKIVWAKQSAYTHDDDYTDYVFRTLGIGRLNHIRAVTDRYLVNDRQTFALERSNDTHDDIEFHGSAGFFITTYQTLAGRKGLGVLLRDRIDDVSRSQPDRHMILGFRGFVEDDEHFSVYSIVTAKFDKKGRVRGTESIPVTPENAARMLACVALNIDQMLKKQPLTAPANWERTGTMDMETLTNPSRLIAPNP